MAVTSEAGPKSKARRFSIIAPVTVISLSTTSPMYVGCLYMPSACLRTPAVHKAAPPAPTPKPMREAAKTSQNGSVSNTREATTLEEANKKAATSAKPWALG